MHHRVVMTAALAIAVSTGFVSARAEPRAVIELFTSQGCSSCPPADRLVGELARDPSIVAMSLPVDYWDYLGWKDTLANPRHTARQRGYASLRQSQAVRLYSTAAAVFMGRPSHALGPTPTPWYVQRPMGLCRSGRNKKLYSSRHSAWKIALAFHQLVSW